MTSNGSPSRPPIDELLSGYLDGALTQQDEQRVHVHLESSAEARSLLEDLRAMREAARGTAFVPPPDDRQWFEGPGSGASRVLRRGGWVMLIAWIAVLGGTAAVELFRSPESVWDKLMFVGGFSAFALLLLSVGLDRWKASATDRYRRVRK